MPICHNRKLIFVHIPKNGGTSIEKSLNLEHLENLYSKTPIKYSGMSIDKSRFTSNKELDDMWYRTPQHLTAEQIRKLYPIVFNNPEYKSFAIVRNPYDRLVSEWAYIQSHAVTLSKDFKNMSFDEFAYSVFLLPSFTRTLLFDSHLDTQKSYIVDNNGNTIVNNVFRFEEIHECFNWLNIPSAKCMESNHRSYHEYYNKDLQKFVYDIYKEDFEHFKYPYDININ